MSNNNIFNSKIFYEFFLFCTKRNIDFVLEISEKSKIKYNSNENKLTASLSKKDDEFKPQMIYSVWNKIIDNNIVDIDEKEKIKKELNDLFEK
jgi:hypothetical protein